MRSRDIVVKTCRNKSNTLFKGVKKVFYCDENLFLYKHLQCSKIIKFKEILCSRESDE